MANKISLRDDDDQLSTYELSDSENEGFTDTEKKLLKGVLNKTPEEYDSEEEVYGLKSGGDTSDEDENADSDIENNDDYLPDERAWGKKKTSYYSTDYVDNDLAGYQEKDVDAAQFEEEEAKKIQQRLLDQFDEDDFSLEMYKPKKVDTKDKKQSAIKIKADMQDKEKQKLILEESPELIGLLEDFKEKVNEVIETLAPILDLVDNGYVENDEVFVKYIRLKYNVIMRYLIYIKFYLLLKSGRANTKYHPVIKQIVQYRELYNQLESANDEKLETKIQTILSTSTDASNKKSKPKKPLLKTTKKLQAKRKRELSESSKHSEEPAEEKKVRFASRSDDSDSDSSANEPKEPEAAEEEESKEDEQTLEKRAITYQMAKNKGLTPKRKKEQRNPRVKHRNKFRQAKIRRKGAVREVRKEITRYGGEISGIKANVSKSIKIK